MDTSPVRNIAILDASRPRRAMMRVSDGRAKFHTNLAEFREQGAAVRRLAARDRSFSWALLRLTLSVVVLPFALIWVGMAFLLARVLPMRSSGDARLSKDLQDPM